MVKRRPSGELSQRQLRVGEMVRRALAELLAADALIDHDIPDVAITVGEVRMSPDLRQATVFVFPLGGEHAELIVEALNSEKRELRHQLNKSVRLKFSPKLTFVVDPLYDTIDRMSHLFSQRGSETGFGKAVDLNDG